MKRKKFLQSLLCTVCTIGLLTACGSDADSSHHLFVLKGTPVLQNQPAESNSRANEPEASSQTAASQTDNSLQQKQDVSSQTAASQTDNSLQQKQDVSSQTAASPTDNSLPNEQVAASTSQLYSAHGALQVSDGSLLDASGNLFQVYGMSTHGLSWFPQYVNYDTFQTLRDDWKTNCIRLAMYSAEYNGYCTGGDKEQLKTLVKNGIDYATALDMYVIVDWHVLGDQDPNVYKEEAKTFFAEISSEYAAYDNIIYEICNEPNGYATWDSVRTYANEVIPVIRSNDSNAVIIVGTPTWSQNIDQAAASPLDYDNILYALHFYAGTHKEDLRSRLQTCVENGLPVFVSEFGMCDASGNGGNDFASATQWLSLIEEYHLSFCCWNLSNKAESSSVLSSSCQSLSNWSENELSESGKWIRSFFVSKSEE